MNLSPIVYLEGASFLLMPLLIPTLLKCVVKSVDRLLSTSLPPVPFAAKALGGPCLPTFR